MSQAPWNISKTSYHPFQILSEDEIESIHLASLKVLRDYGMEILDGACRDLAKVAGASIDGDCVRFDPELIEELIAKAPDKVTVHARNAKHDVPLHPGHTCIASVGGPAFSTDIDNGRRAANFADMCNFSRLVQSLNIIHMEGGGAVEPVDLPANTRHLDMYMAFATLTDKTWTGYALGADRAQDSIEMAAMAAGLSLEEAVDKPVVLTVISPLISDWRNFETWQEDGKPEAVHHANRTWKLLLDEYEEPAMDAGTREALEAFVAKRKQQVS